MYADSSKISELDEILDRTADRIVAYGTRVAPRTLLAMAATARDLKPGASAALIDWNGSEIARLRAFGIVHGVLIRDLTASARSHLLAYGLGTAAHELAA